MIHEIKMPSAGQTTDEARIVSVNVSVGDTVQRGDVLVEAETDKAVLPVESFAAGQVLKILVNVGDQVDAGTVLVAVGKPGETYGGDAPGAAEAPAVPQPAAPAPAPAKKVGTEIKMPSAGQTTDEAKIVCVHVRPGDTVKRGDVLMEAETDKAVLPVESFAQGQILDVLVGPGDTVTAGTVLAIVGSEKDAAVYRREECARSAAPVPQSAPAPAPAAERCPPREEYLPIMKGAAPAVPAAPAAGGKVWPAMPNAKMLAREKGIDLSLLTPANGRFLKRQDVLAYTPQARPAEAEAPAAAGGEAEYDVLPMSRMRQVIARRMQQSVSEIPAFQCTIHVDMRGCMALRDSFKEKRDIKLSYNDILAKAIAVASRKFPLVNARYEKGEIRVYHHSNVGLAVGLESALVVPVVREIDRMNLEQISTAYKAMVRKARENKLAPSDMGCGSITISNLGMYDVDSFTAIVNPPESAILALGSIRMEPEWDGKEFRPVPTMHITGSFDHRIIDGAYGAQFLRELKLLMENPGLML